uniref:Uncharacterized protein n=1 Tax=Otus sunia TaxID=257818 RepID=A0A8C8ALX1_9STRI
MQRPLGQKHQVKDGPCEPHGPSLLLKKRGCTCGKAAGNKSWKGPKYVASTFPPDSFLLSGNKLFFGKRQGTQGATSLNIWVSNLHQHQWFPNTLNDRDLQSLRQNLSEQRTVPPRHPNPQSHPAFTGTKCISQPSGGTLEIHEQQQHGCKNIQGSLCLILPSLPDSCSAGTSQRDNSITLISMKNINMNNSMSYPPSEKVSLLSLAF